MDVTAFFKRIIQSIFTGLLWLAINTTMGIMYGFAFIEKKLSIGNLIFYLWFLLSLVLLIWFFLRLWKRRPGEEGLQEE